jgi:hypothetical protein
MKKRALLLALLLVLTAAGLDRHAVLGTEADPGPILGVHTIRADDALLQQVDDGGFRWLIQLLEWRAVEPVPGDYFWEYPDWLVRAAEYYGLDLVLRLDHPPEWAMTTGEDLPVDLTAYTRFVGQVAERYQGRVLAYVIWNEPNLAAEWGGLPPNAAGYARLLCAARAQIKAVDPKALVVSAGLAPTNHTTDLALDERRYLQEIYAAGAADCFDVLGAHPYGFAYPPDDEYGAHNGLNVARLADLRTLMVETGDENKPVWATEVGWTTDPVGPERQWLRVDEDQQRRYLVGFFEKSAREWSWLEQIAVWNLSTGLAAGDERRGYSLLAEDGTPNAALGALTALAREQKDSEVATPELRLPDAETAVALAPDVIVRLSDVDTFYPHWARPHCGMAPCRQWAGLFYVRHPGQEPWQLRMEILQVEEHGNLVWINGSLLDPPAIPLRGRPDFASVWTAAEMPVPASLLQPGANVIEIESSPRLPMYQDRHARFESLQLRHIRLVSGSP